jgi:hypothetical protein
MVQGVHEFDFICAVVPLAGGGINLPTAVNLRPTFQLAPFHWNGYVFLPSVGALATITHSPVHV